MLPFKRTAFLKELPLERFSLKGIAKVDKIFVFANFYLKIIGQPYIYSGIAGVARSESREKHLASA